MHSPNRVLGTVAVAALLTTTAATAVPALAAPTTDTSELRAAVTAAGVAAHLEELQSIADANGGTRASGTPGYDASAEYVSDALRDAGYTVSRQTFDYELFLEDAPSVLEVDGGGPFVDHEDFIVMEYSGSGSSDVGAVLQAVDLVLPPGPTASSSNSGCETTDFAGFMPGNIALMQRGTCDFRVKAENAAAAGASAAIIFNEGQEGRTDLLNGTLTAPQLDIPTIGTTFAVGEELATLDGAAATVSTTVHVEQRTTSNVIAETQSGRPDRVVMAGAHLDSVLEGPGINDNGSGSAAILETALKMAEQGVDPENRVRFAFWGAEESGLIGSQHYVDSLSKRQQKNIMLYLNFDMVASPNFVRFVYDGDGDTFGIEGPNGSDHIEATFSDFFASQGLASEPTQFDGRSDYDAFITAGIPAGGLFTGAEGVKTEEQAAVYGGTAGLAYDSCYHSACDTIDNINLDALEQMSDAIAHTTLTYAMSESNVKGTKSSTAGGTSTFERKGPHTVR